MFGASRETVRAWVRGEEPIPVAVWDELVARVRAIVAREDRPLKDVVVIRLVGAA